MKIVIVAARRSGSTIFWKCFRQATQATCFDEPFNPWLNKLPQEHAKQVCQEYINYLKKYHKRFWEFFSPIYPLEELKSSWSPSQVLYLHELLQQDRNVVIDTTRCWNKISELQQVAPSDTFLIHLHRAPASFVTSHLLPSDDARRSSFLRTIRRKQSFWTRDSDYNKWNMVEIFGTGLLSAFHLLILKEHKIAERFYNAPAAYKLLKFWSIAFEKVEAEGNNCFGSNFMSVRFEDFCKSPMTILKQVSKKTGLEFDFGRLPRILPVKPAYQVGSQQWKKAACYWGLSESNEYLFRT